MKWEKLAATAAVCSVPAFAVLTLMGAVVAGINQHFERAEEARKEAAYKAQWAQLVRECMANPPAWSGVQVHDDDCNLKTLWSSPLEVCDSRAHDQLNKLP